MQTQSYITHGLDTQEQVFFYEQEFYPLSNFSAFTVYWKYVTFPTLEHAYHWEKFEQETIQQDILYASSAHEAFTLAQEHKNKRRRDWDLVKVDIMLNLVRAKFQQHEYARRKLIETGTRELIENSWRDDFWGWGINKDGKNMLGKILMQVREEIKG